MITIIILIIPFNMVNNYSKERGFFNVRNFFYYTFTYACYVFVYDNRLRIKKEKYIKMLLLSEIFPLVFTALTFLF